jgi:hypothetical protein
MTTDPVNRVLTNTDVWSPDGQWIYYDVRSDAAGSVFDGDRIERVHVRSGQIETVYRAGRGACCGVVTANPTRDEIVFIHGPEDPTPDWQYAKWHRRGVLVQPGIGAVNLDACDIVAPYTPGALRGGSHVHVFSHDGNWVSFTYEDHVLETSPSGTTQLNQRNVAITALRGPHAQRVRVPKSHPRNHDGEGFSVAVTRTWDQPEPGSDQIQRADGDAWIGRTGYVRSDGSRQVRAIAFIGDVVDQRGNVVPELYIVDLPEDPTRACHDPLCGTSATRPSPPIGTHQRRLTFTADRRHPGLGPQRHWVRSSPDGSLIAFLMRDDRGICQLWTITPHGQDMRQRTFQEAPVQSAFSFRGDGQAIACVVGDQVCEVHLENGQVQPWTASHASPSPRPEAVVYSPDDRRIAYVRRVTGSQGTFNQIFVAERDL